MVLFVQSLIKIMERHFHMFEIFYSRDSLKPWISRLGDPFSFFVFSIEWKVNAQYKFCR